MKDDGITIGKAGREDDRELLAILEEEDFKGNISLLYTRRPSPSMSMEGEGRDTRIYVLKDNGMSVKGVGACAVNHHYISGKESKAGYLFNFRIKQDGGNVLRYLGQLPEAYRHALEELENDGVTRLYSTILEENLTARAMLEKRRKSMPVYNYEGDITTYNLKTGGSGSLPPGWLFEGINRGGIRELIEYYRNEGKKFDLFPCISEEDIENRQAAPGITSFRILRDPDGKIQAAGAVWDRIRQKQYIVTGYRGLLKVLQPLSQAVFPLLGYPSLPAPETPLKLFFLSFLLVRNNAPEIFHIFLRNILKEQKKNFDICSFSFHERHPLDRRMKRYRSIRYRSRLYTVAKGENEQFTIKRIPHIEAGRL